MTASLRRISTVVARSMIGIIKPATGSSVAVNSLQRAMYRQLLHVFPAPEISTIFQTVTGSSWPDTPVSVTPFMIIFHHDWVLRGASQETQCSAPATESTLIPSPPRRRKPKILMGPGRLIRVPGRSTTTSVSL